MRNNIITTIFFLITVNSYSQTQLQNKWYTFSFDPIKVVEYNFNKATFLSKKLDWELKPLPGTQTAKIIRIINQNGNVYYLMQEKQNPNPISLTLISQIKPDFSFIQPSLSEETTYFKNISEALKFIKVDTLHRPGITFFSQKEFLRLKSLPSATTIRKNDFKTYLLTVIKIREEFESFAKDHKDDFGFMFFFYYFNNQTRVTLANLGYNPLIADKELQDIEDKFKEDPELSALMDQAFKFE